MKKYTLRFLILFIIISFVTLVNVQAQTVDFTISVPSKQGCVPLAVNFTDVSTGAVQSRTWDLGNGTIISNGGTTVGANYLNAQTYIVKLTVTYTNGTILSKTDNIIVHPKPVADFASADSIGCAAHNATFQNLSTSATGSITNWQWDFGAGGVNGNFPTPSFSYANAGLYQVSLIVKNNWGCVSGAQTKPQYIKVFPPPTANFTVNPSFTCTNSFTAVFTNNTTGGDIFRNKYEWDFGDGSPIETTTNATHLYIGTGNYTATLKVKLSNNCVSIYTYPIYVGKPTGTITTFPNEVCQNNAINFIGTGSPNTYYLRWYFSDDAQTQYYGNVSHTFLTSGTFELLLIARNYAGCEDTVRRNVIVKAGPQIAFTANLPNANCKPHTVIFTNNTIGANLKFAWNYGDGSPIDTINGQGSATHTYTNFGYYTVTLYAKDTSVGTGCFAYNAFNYIKILQPSVILFAVPPSGCLPLPVLFSLTTSSVIVPILSYDWNFGDGSPVENTISPTNSHVYNTAGSFSATVTMNMQGGCSYTSAVKIITVDAICDDDGSGGGGAGGGGFTIGKTCADKYTILFTDTVSNSTVQAWNFGDGMILTIGVLNPISHTYTGPQKIYTVVVTRKNAITNVISTGTKRIKIIDEKANFIPTIFDICKDKNVQFKTIGIDSSLIKKYTWDFGDGNPRFVINNANYFINYGLYLNGNTNHTYTTNGTFFVKLFIEDKLGCLDSFLYPVPIVVAGPIAKFVATPFTSCTSPLLTNITSTSIQNGTTPITEWQWTYGDGTPLLTTTVDSVLHHNYTGATPASFYTLKLKIKDAIGCEADTTATNYVRLYKPKADFFSYNTLQCGNYQILLYGYISQAVNPTYQWIFGDGSVSLPSTNYYVYHTYATEGNYDIKLLITDENGCKDSITRLAYINIVKPVADFKINDTLQCAPASITFSDSSKFATTYLWDFGDGSGPSTAQNPAPHIYGVPGFYDVKLSITGPNGCTSFKIKRIRVRGPIGTLVIGTSQGCKPYTLPLSITNGSFISTYSWDFGDGTPVIPSNTATSIYHVYNFAGKYLPNIILTSPEGCPFNLKATDSVIVDSLKAKFTTIENVFCQTSTNQTVLFNNLTSLPAFSSLLNSKWNFGDGTTLSSNAATVSHTYTGYGTFNVYLATKSQYGCTDTFRLANPIVINAKPIPTITGANVYCLKPASVLSYIGGESGSNIIAKYKWKIDNDSVANTQNLNINYRIAGSHILKFIVTTNIGCVDSVEKFIIIDSVVAKFTNTLTQFCGPKIIPFTNTSTYYAAIQNYLWSFGDGNTNSTYLSPSHLYAYTGSYNVKLFMQTVNGCTDSITQNAAVIIDSIPKPSITGDVIFCLKPTTRISFTSSVVTLNPITIYKWFIDNNQVASTQNLNIDYRIPGSHTVKLYVETVKGCYDSVEKIIIIDSVVAKFTNTLTQFCGPKIIPFTNTSTNYAAIQNYLWSFGDGSTNSTYLSPSHLYAYTGSYNVKLFMQTVNGCTDNTIVPIAVRIDSIPKAIITGNTLECKPGLYLYNSNNSISQNTIANYQWKVDGNVVANTPNLSYYFYAGNHTINLKIKASTTCEHDTTIAIIIDSLKASFTPTDVKICGNNGTIQFNNSGAGKFPITGYKWTFGDGQVNITLANPLHTYNQIGEYDVNLKLTSTNNCTHDTTILKAVKIYKKPSVSIQGDEIKCSPNNYTYNSLENTINTIETYKWSINNIEVANTTNLNYNFTAGQKDLKLIVITDKGCTDTATKLLKIDSLVSTYTIANPIKCGVPADINFISTAYAKFGIQTYLWNFGNSSTTNNNLANPTSTYTSNGVFATNLKIFSNTGCDKLSTLINSVTIYAKPTISISGLASACANTILSFKGTATGTGDQVISKEWKVNNIVVGNTDTLDYLFTTANTYAVTYNVKTQYGCDVTQTKTVIINPLPIPIATPQLAKICLGKSIMLNAATGNNFLYEWTTNAPNTIINANTSSPTVMPTIDTKYYVLVTNQFGCKKTDSVFIKVDKPVNLTSSNNVTICENASTRLSANGNTNNFVWAPPTGLDNPNSRNPLASPAATTIYQVVGYSSNVCKNDTALVTVFIDPTPTVNLGADITPNAGTVITLNAVASNTVTNYTWYPTTGLSCTTCPKPSFTADKSIKYTVKVYTQYGCKNEDEIVVKVLCGKGAIYIPNAFTPNGDNNNDRFGVIGFGIGKVKSFTIFNRYGEIVFQRKDYVPIQNDKVNSWDGKIKGQQVTEPTVYVYVAEVQCEEGQTFVLKNTITLIK